MPDQAKDTYDVIVVGGGTAGSVVAARLSEDANVRVLLLEAGGKTPPEASAVPPAWPTLVHTDWCWGDLTTVQAATDLASPIARGRGLGGSSAINAMVFARGHHKGYDSWAESGAKGWHFEDMLPYFKRSETARDGHTSLRGRVGPLLVGPADPPNPVLVSILDAAAECGYRRASDISSGLEIGFGFTDLNIVNGRRQTAADAYLLPAACRPNLDVVVDAVVHQLKIEGDRCTGVEYSIRTSQDVLSATAGDVILSAGAIGSPQLLMRSGVGPATHLREVGIDVVADMPGVGSNLHDHPLVPLVYRSAKTVPTPQNNHGELLGLVRTGRTGDVPDIQMVGVDSSVVPGLGGVDHAYVLAVSALQPFSRGTVRLSGPDADAKPVIDPNYFGDQRDLDTMVEGLRLARQIGAARALDEWRAEELAPGGDVTDDDGLGGYVKQMFASYFHPVGTCAIGDGPDSVVDSDLRVHNIGGLRVIDASVMPTIPSNNTVATVYAIAELGADLIRRDR